MVTLCLKYKMRRSEIERVRTLLSGETEPDYEQY